MSRSTASSVHLNAQPKIHPSADVMADFTAGQLHPYRRWMVEAHLELCATCRGLAARGSRLGGAWFDSLAGSAPASPPAGEVGMPELWERLDAQVSEEAARASYWPEIPLPRSIRREIESATLGTQLDSSGREFKLRGASRARPEGGDGVLLGPYTGRRHLSGASPSSQRRLAGSDGEFA